MSPAWLRRAPSALTLFAPSRSGPLTAYKPQLPFLHGIPVSFYHMNQWVLDALKNYVHEYMSVHHMCAVPLEARRGRWYPRTRVTDNIVLPCKCRIRTWVHWDQWVLLTTGSSPVYVVAFLKPHYPFLLLPHLFVSFFSFVCHRAVVLSLWVTTPLGVKQLFHRAHLGPSESTEIYIDSQQ